MIVVSSGAVIHHNMAKKVTKEQNSKLFFCDSGNLIKHYQEEHPGCIEMPDLNSNSSAEDDNADDTESCDRSKQGTPAPEVIILVAIMLVIMMVIMVTIRVL